MRQAVKDLLKLGKLPTEADGGEYWDKYFAALLSIERPVSSDEADALLLCFNDSENEDANGGAERLITLIESCPDFVFKRPPDFKNAWHKRMWDRQNR
jgi:hypothetical protein